MHSKILVVAVLNIVTPHASHGRYAKIPTIAVKIRTVATGHADFFSVVFFVSYTSSITAISFLLAFLILRICKIANKLNSTNDTP